MLGDENPSETSSRSPDALTQSERRVDAEIFKAVMRRLAGGVVVITANNNGSLYGMTATAFCSVCADPPTILIIVNRSTRTHPHIQTTRKFAVNILSDRQRDIAERFAGKLSDQFAGVNYILPPDGSPAFVGAAASLQCEVTQCIEIGTHTVFIARVADADAAELTPLLYHSAQYHRLSAIN